MMHKSFTFLFVILATVKLTGCTTSSTLAPLQHIDATPLQRTVTLNIKGYCPRSGNTFKEIFALNKTATVLDGMLVEDFDGDGVANILDANAGLGINPYLADSNNDGYSDLLVFLLGIPLASQGSLPQCNQTGRQDTDHDGLSDCEEAVLGTSASNADSDGDGIPDLLELRYGLDPLDPRDALLNPSGDGVSNYQKVKLNLDTREYETAAIATLAYRYATSTSGTLLAPCYDFSISNVPLAQVPNGNQFAFYLLERPNTPGTGTVPTTLSFSAHVTVDSKTPVGSQLTYSFSNIED